MVLSFNAALARVIEESPIATALLDAGKVEIASSRKWREGYRIHFDTAVGGRGGDSVETPVRDARDKALSCAAVTRAEEEVHADDGTVRSIAWQFQPWRQEQGKPGGLIVTAESLASGTERLYQAYFEHADFGAAQINPDLSFANVNRRFCEITGYAPRDLLEGMTPLDLDHPDEREKDRARILRMFQSEANSYECTKRFVKKDGAAIWVRVRSRTIADESGRPYTTAAMIEDITAQKIAEEALSRFRRIDAIGQLTAGIVHDFNNLLTILSGNLALAGSRTIDGKTRAFLDRCLAAVDRGNDITRRLLAFACEAKIEASPQDLNQALEDAVQLLRTTLPENIDIKSQVEAPLWQVATDRGEFESAIVNLAINARDAMPAGGSLTLRTSNVTLDQSLAAPLSVAPGDYVRIDVVDTGVGMTPDVLRKCTKAFFTTKPEGKGNGLGLSGAYAFATASGGTLNVASEAGRGATVSILLPRYRQSAHLGEVRTRRPVADDRTVVLVVEDDAALREVTVDRLEGMGFAAIEAASGREGIDILQQEGRIDIVFSDVGLPGSVSGHDLVLWIRDNRPGTKVLLTSGYKSAALHERFRGIEAQILAKPYTQEEFAKRIGAATPV